MSGRRSDVDIRRSIEVLLKLKEVFPNWGAPVVSAQGDAGIRGLRRHGDETFQPIVNRTNYPGVREVGLVSAGGRSFRTAHFSWLTMGGVGAFRRRISAFTKMTMLTTSRTPAVAKIVFSIHRRFCLGSFIVRSSTEAKT